MTRTTRSSWLAIALVAFAPAPALAQEATETPPPAVETQGQVPEVEVIQEQAPQPAPKPKPAAAKPKPKPKPQQQAAPAPAPVPAVVPPPADDFADLPPPGPNRDSADGRVTSTARPVTSPVDPKSLVPKNIQDFAGAATRIDSQQLDEQRPLTTHEALARVPGIVTVTDDGLGRHSGIGIRGSNFRRSRKVLVMEDGASINFSSYLDASTHYTPPLDRIENIEVIRGTVISHGPLNNHGIVNFQNLSPFGAPETVIRGSLSYTDDVDKEIGNYRHVHTRQHHGNVGAVVSYSGAEAPGAWELERLRYNDFYGALGWKGVDQDLTVSASYNRQRDDYDEDNFVGTIEDFYANGRRKPSDLFDDGGFGGFSFNTYNAEHLNMQIAHNYYINDDTTLSTRIYGHNHDRRRFSSRDDGPRNPDDGHMRGRERDYEMIGADSRIEFANVPLVGGINQDIQAGIRYEHHKLTNCTSFGRIGEVLDGSNSGNCRAVDGEDGRVDDGEITEYRADSFAAFIQSAIHMTPNLTVTPGLRFEHYEVDAVEVFGGDGLRGSSDHDHVLPGVAFAWEAMLRSTFYGGYHRGFAPHIVRDVDIDGFPLEEEVGDNFQIGLRSTAIKGMTFDVAYFHSFIDGYQLKEGYTSDDGDNVYGLLDEVEINGVELAARIESRPFTGGPWNFFGEAQYTYTNGKITQGQDSIFEDVAPTLDVSGNRLPFTVEHFANLTLGVAYQKLWDLSVTATYRGDFFTNAANTVPLTCVTEDDDDNLGLSFGCGSPDSDELVGGKVDDVWLLSARANYNFSDQLSMFVAGTNLTDELYVAELSDGAKPGLGRTIFGGFTLKFD